MLNVGLIGLGAEWEHRYRPALEKLRPRLQVRSVCTPVIAHAEQVAAELDCDVSPGLVTLLEREDVRAVLVLDTAWYAGVPARLACEAGKPAFLAGRLVHRLPIADQLLRRAAETGVTLMPDFGHRYTPATSRLRELIATRLGRPLSIVVEASVPGGTDDAALLLTDAERDALAAMIDWCTCLVGTAPAAVRANFGGEAEPGPPGLLRELSIEYRQPAAGGGAACGWIRLDRQSPPLLGQADVRDATPIVRRARVQCLKGTAWIEGPQNVTWESADEQVAESLASDRPAVEVMLDHFTRRVVGGLIPVPTLDELCRVFQLLDLALGNKPSR